MPTTTKSPTTAADLRTRSRKARKLSSPLRFHDDIPYPVKRNTARRQKLLGGVLATASLCCWMGQLLGRDLLHEDASKNAKSKKDTFSPWNSHPPKPIALDTQHNPRHACLAQIRARQETILGKSATATTNSSGILLVDPAYHSNVGDHMITLAELQFLLQQSHNKNEEDNHDWMAPLHQCSYVQAGEFVPRCELEIPRLHATSTQHSSSFSSLWTAVWHGGGNWGDLWRRAQEPRIASFETLLQYHFTPIVTMPNSWYYRNKLLEAQDVQAIRARIVAGLLKQQQQPGGSTSREDDIDDARLQELAPLVLTWREQSSYERATHMLPWAVHLLVPDIAFQLGPYDAAAIRAASASQQENSGTLVDLVFLLRDDHESLYAHQRNRRAIRDVLQSVLGASQFTFSIVDWNDRLDRFLDSEHHKDDIFFTDTAVQLLALGRIVVCDRLHAAILAYLAGLPFIYLDQVSGKISKTFAVAMDSGDACRQDAKWAAATDLKDAVRQAVDFMSRYHLQSPKPISIRQQHPQQQKT